MTSMTSRIIQLGKEGLSPADINRELGAGNIRTIYSALSSARRRGVDIPRHSGRKKKTTVEITPDTVAFPPSVLGDLKPAADARGITVEQLARKLIANIIDDNLIDAVLDDNHQQ